MNYFRLSFFYLLFNAFISTSVSAQIVQKYGDNNGTINSNSVLELESTNKGLLLPRIPLESTTLSNPLSAHVQGMTVYNTATTGDVIEGIYINSGAKWVRGDISSVPAANITGTLAVANGGTGVTTIAEIQTILGLAGSNVAIGATSGVTTQGTNAIAIGEGSGNLNQGSSSVAIGPSAGASNQGATSVAIGSNAAQSGSGASSVAIGFAAAQSGSGANSVVIGSYASSSGANSLAIGASANTDSYTNSVAIGNQASSTADNTIQLGNTSGTNVSTSGTITAGAVTYPNTHGTANQVLSTTGSGTLGWTDVSKNITSTEVALNTKINGVQLYTIQGSFYATGTSTAVSVTPPSNMSGYYSMTTYKDGKTFRKEIFSFDATTATNNVITGTGPYTEIYPAGNYNYVLEYFK